MHRTLLLAVSLIYAETMASTPNVDEAVDLARQSQEDKIEAVRKLAEARQTVEDVKTQLSAAEGADLKAWNHAVSLGWPETELKRIGFKEPEKKRRPKKQGATRSRFQSAASPVTRDFNQEDSGSSTGM